MNAFESHPLSFSVKIFIPVKALIFELHQTENKNLDITRVI